MAGNPACPALHVRPTLLQPLVRVQRVDEFSCGEAALELGWWQRVLRNQIAGVWRIYECVKMSTCFVSENFSSAHLTIFE